MGPARRIAMTAKFGLGASCVLFLFFGLAGCATDWWTVDPGPYVPPEQSAAETAAFGTRAPVGESRGTGDVQEPGKEDGQGEEPAGDPSFQPHPGK